MLNIVVYKNEVFKDYFIDTETGRITDKEGNVEPFGFAKTYLNWRKMPVHCIQAHSMYGYIKGYDTHHVNENKLDNSLSNLEYIPHGEHTRKTNHHRGVNPPAPTFEEALEFLNKLGIPLSSYSLGGRRAWKIRKIC